LGSTSIWLATNAKATRYAGISYPRFRLLILHHRAEETQRDFLSLLYAGNPDPLEVMKKKELHDLLVEAVNRSENVARTLERIVIKNG
jgi:hypothetical protein